jgi:DNA-binding GntR family transcriptional regulator
VAAGQLAPGAAVTEAALARQLEVSRTPVREVLLLEGEGLLESSPARGFVVRGLSRAEADELYPTLICLEAFAVRSGPGLAGLASQVRASMSRYELSYMTRQVDRRRADRQHRDILARLGGGDTDAAAQVLELLWTEGHRAVVDAMPDQDLAR